MVIGARPINLFYFRTYPDPVSPVEVSPNIFAEVNPTEIIPLFAFIFTLTIFRILLSFKI
jgi:hypothetical protein